MSMTRHADDTYLFAPWESLYQLFKRKQYLTKYYNENVSAVSKVAILHDPAYPTPADDDPQFVNFFEKYHRTTEGFRAVGTFVGTSVVPVPSGQQALNAPPPPIRAYALEYSRMEN